jgi:hypothetical protein
MFWRAAFLLPWVKASLQWRGYHATYSCLQKQIEEILPQHGEPKDISKQVSRTCRMLGAAQRRWPLKFTCLEESLILWYLLRRQGITSRLRIGVRKVNGKFEAHAWVEQEGEALNQPGQLHRHYSAFEQEISEPPAEPS